MCEKESANYFPPNQGPSEKTWAEITDGLVSAVFRKQNDILETFVAAYLKESGLSISEVELVQQKTDDGWRWYLRPKLPNEF